MTKPTIGRVVHFFPATTDPLHRDDEPLAATIVRVWSNTCVNLALFDGDGHCGGVCLIDRHHDGDVVSLLQADIVAGDGRPGLGRNGDDGNEFVNEIHRAPP